MFQFGWTKSGEVHHGVDQHKKVLLNCLAFSNLILQLSPPLSPPLPMVYNLYCSLHGHFVGLEVQSRYNLQQLWILKPQKNFNTKLFTSMTTNLPECMQLAAS